MQTLELNGEIGKSEPQKGFWRRQFQKKSTRSQRVFDWIFGVVLPVICFVFDPTVFKGGFFGPANLGNYKPLAYVLSFILVMAMSAWLVWGEKLKWLNAFLAGLFAVGSLISLAIGIVLLPFSLLGLIVLIGILGFTPLLTSIVYLRGSLRAFHAAKPFLERKILIRSFVLSVLFSAVVPWVLNVQVQNALDEMSRGDARTIRAKARGLKYVAPLVNFDVLARQYALENEKMDDERKAAFAEVYRELTGENIESRTNILMD